MKEKLIKTIDLENGMKLNFYDGSRKLAGDRWLVSLIIRMEIPVTEVSMNEGSESTKSVDEIKNVLGEKILFEQKRERIFVNETEKQAAIEYFTQRYAEMLNQNLEEHIARFDSFRQK